MRLINKYGDDIGSIFDYYIKDLYLMLRYRNCSIMED